MGMMMTESAVRKRRRAALTINQAARGKGRNWEIYTLSDPRTLRARYVGVTFVGETTRCRRHCASALKGRTHRDNWIRSVLRLNLRPIYLVLEYGQGAGWQERERFWIATHRKFCDLTNLTDGGDGVQGYKASPETCAKISAAQKGRVLTAEHRASMSTASQNRSPEHRAKLSAALKGRQFSPETKAKMSAAQKGRIFTAEHRAKMSAALKGHIVTAATRAKISAANKRHKEKPWSAARRRAQKNRMSQKGGSA